MRPVLAAIALATQLASSAAAAPAPGVPDWRAVDPENTLVIDTSKGRIIVEMAPDVAPAHVAQIKALARQHLYDGLTFFRVIDGFMDQTGDPQNTGEGSSSLPNLKAEFTFRRDATTPFVEAAEPMGETLGMLGSLPIISLLDGRMATSPDHKVSAWVAYCPGVAGMARDDDPDSANSQFFLMRAAYPTLNAKYTAWGRVLVGLDVVDAIKTGEPPPDPDKMLQVRVLADLPEAQRPKVSVMDVRGAAFAKVLAQVRQQRGADFSICDVVPPTKVG